MAFPFLTALFAPLFTSLGTAGAISTGLTAASGVLGAYASYTNQRAQAKALSASARNAEIAGKRQLEAGYDESDKLQRQAALARGRSRAEMAANGMDPTSADALSFLDQERELADDDAFTIRENALWRAQGQAQRAANFKTEASTAKSASVFEPVGTLLTTGARVGSRYAQWAAQEAAQEAY